MDDIWMDIKSFDKDGITIEVHDGDSIYIPDGNSQFVYITFEKMTWWEYVKYIFRKIFLNDKREDWER